MANNNPQRERILARLHAATPADSAHREAGGLVTSGIFPVITDKLARFLSECAANLTEVVTTRDCAESVAAFERVLPSITEGELFFQDAEVLRNWTERVNGARTVRWSSEGQPHESTQATVTLAHAFIAQTGSILTSSRCGGRGASIVPPCHIVFGNQSQIVPDIQAALEQAREQLLDASFVGLITGSSRTADIEKILVQGAHGPRRVVLILQEQD
jgi:L-lactate dehydrogenase complex protein LldG